MEGKEDNSHPQYYYGDSVFKEVMQSVMDTAWIVCFVKSFSLMDRRNGKSWTNVSKTASLLIWLNLEMD